MTTFEYWAFVILVLCSILLGISSHHLSNRVDNLEQQVEILENE